MWLSRFSQLRSFSRFRRFRKRRAQRLHDEIQFHRDSLIEDYMAAGMSRREAERRALLEFGGVPQIEEASRDVRGRLLADLGKDLRYALRTLRRSPGFAAAAVLSLALGIGANAAIFTLIEAVLLRALPVQEPQRLVQIARLTPEGRPANVSYPLFEYFRDHVHSVSGAFAHWGSDQAIKIDGDEEFVAADLVTGAYHTVLGLEPIAGRLLTPADDTLSSETSAAVISERYWDRRFGRSPAAIGTLFTIRDLTFTIVGVTPASFQSVRHGRAADVTIPQVRLISDEHRREATANVLGLIARLKPGATIDQANAEVQVLWRAFIQSQAAAAPERQRAEILNARAAVLPAADGINPLRYDLRPLLLILMGIVVLVLLLACANLSGLLLARAAARQREISIRLAIGASRGRLVRQLLTESLVLAAAGGALGLVIATWFSDRLLTTFASGRDIALSVGPDWRVLAFTFAISLAACLISGLAPALQAVRGHVNPALKEVRASGPRALGRILVGAQLSISMILIVGATLFVGTLVKLYAVERGFESTGVLIATLRSSQQYTGERGKAVQRALLERLQAVPGIRSASATQFAPISGNLWTRSVQVEGYVFRSDEADTVAFNAIAPAYFTTIGTPLVSGREFDARDGEQSPKVTIVNETFARSFFGNGPALGRHVTSVGVTYEIVGVVRDTKYRNLRDPVMKTMYIPWMQRDGDPPTRYAFLARVQAGDPMRFAPIVERLVRDVDPALHVRATYSYETLIERSLVTERIMAALAGAFGLLALIIASLGVFGVLAFQVSRRTNELGVRMALGATRGALMRLVMGQVAWMVLPAITIGAIGAFLLTGLARKLLFGLTPADPRVFLIAALTLTLAAAFAAWLPARRAARIDPLIALRHE